MTAPAFIAIPELLSNGRDPEQTICFRDGKDITWNSFSIKVGEFARVAGQSTNKRWFICCNDAINFVAALLGVFHAGRRAVIPPNFLPGTLTGLVSEHDGIFGDMESATSHCAEDLQHAYQFFPLDPGKTFVDLYTSGSSGQPKPVTKSLAQLDAEIRTLEACWGQEQGNACVIGTVPHHHIYGLLFRLLWPLAAGRRFEAELCSEPSALERHAAAAGKTTLISSPAHLARLPAGMSLGSLRPHIQTVFSSGAPLSQGAALILNTCLGLTVTEVYGSTETGGIAWRRQNQAGASTAWTPFKDIQIAIGQDHVLRLKSRFLPHHDWINLDDSGEMLDETRFILKGRVDRVVKIEGKRLSLQEMEDRLRQHPCVSDAVVVPLSGKKQILGAIVILAEKKGALTSQLRRSTIKTLDVHLRSWYEPVLIPRRWRFPERMPADERGKRSLAVLHKQFEKKHDANAA